LPNKFKIKKKYSLKKVEIMNIIGRVTKDAEVRTTSQDKQVVNFSVATNDSYRNKQGERIEQTTYFDCSYWISSKVAKLLTKGALVELTGRTNARAWIGNDGQAHAGLNFHTSQIKLHTGSKKTETGETASKSEKKKTTKEEKENDLPF
jgi:single-strand DNA-binding protein